MRTVTFTLNIAGRARASATARSKRGSFYLWIAAAMTCTVFTGFWFTYFGPLFGGSYQQVSLIVHVHGWTFFAWYLLLTMQAGLVRFGQVAIHRMLGIASMALAMFMCGVGVIVSTVRIDMGLGPKGDPFWALMGLPIFAVWILFTSFYVAAVYRRRRAEHHKRFMVLASSAAMSAATFRIFVQIFGFETWVAIVGAVSPALFIVAAMINDLQNARRIPRVRVGIHRDSHAHWRGVSAGNDVQRRSPETGARLARAGAASLVLGGRRAKFDPRMATEY